MIGDKKYYIFNSTSDNCNRGQRCINVIIMSKLKNCV